MHKASRVTGAGAQALTLLALQAMPCGCVAGVYQAPSTVVEVELVEAKGPHCRFYQHRAGQVTRLGVAESLTGEAPEDLEPRV